MLNQLSAEIHAENAKWWHDLETGARLDRNKGELLCLIHSEISEASSSDGFDDHLPTRLMVEVEMADAAIRVHDYCGGFKYGLSHRDISPLGMNKAAWFVAMHADVSYIMEAERKNMADMVPTLLSRLMTHIQLFCRTFNLDLDGAIAEKRQYNKQRADHQVEARKATGGKKW